ncbi:hypothetical protein B9G69_000450 [Bdellovibrio sp. SKB1291214]|uniref:hypothetical protein n=1 Tax=Bdellovibrio sp. SKB1291214 TaxID=1732569 RepID=UPI000B515B05|nr:hypothetical protein [Bdellovibrio sp. SKB1291214]UYL09044.1 hypothetical protein B9G69_000450 [Bdellovibrio sp. SKB1291214]
MKRSISKLALLIGTPMILLGYQNCAKLGTDNLLGGSSTFVSSGSTDFASTQSSPDTADSVAPPASQDVSYKKRKTPSVDPLGDEKTLLAKAWKACTVPSSLQNDPNGEFVIQSCLNLFCQSETKTVSSETQKEAMCTALLQVQQSYTL